MSTEKSSERSALVAHLLKSVELWKYFMASVHENTTREAYIAIFVAHTYVKIQFEIHSSDLQPDLHVFPHITPGAFESVPFSNAFEKVLNIPDSNETLTILKKNFDVPRSVILVQAVMDRSSQLLRNAILSELSNIVSSGLSADNPSKNNFSVTAYRLSYFTLQVDENRRYYDSPDYAKAWVNCCHTELREVLSAASTSTLGTRRQHLDICSPDIFYCHLPKFQYTV